MLRRRTFLERLGLGAGAVLLSPIAQSLVAEAQGQPIRRKRVVFYLVGNGLHPDFNFTPTELRSPPNHETPVMGGPRNYTWPAMLKALEPWRQRMLLIDGLANQCRKLRDGDPGIDSHTSAYAALSCMPYGGPGSPNNEVPGGITVDQWIAARIGEATPRKSLLVGLRAGQSTAGTWRKVFASGVLKPEPIVDDPLKVAQDAFGAAAGDAGNGALKRRVLLDSVRGDIGRLKAGLAGSERMKLDTYLGGIEEYEKRLTVAMTAGCKGPVLPAKAPTAPEDRMPLLTEAAGLALACGVTNVVGIALGCGNTHNYLPTFNKLGAGTPVATLLNGSLGHAGGNIQGPGMDLIHNFNATQIAKMIEILSAIKEGDGTAFDNTVFVYMSENGDSHHSTFKRWPVVVIGDAGKALKSDGRFIRYPMRGSPGNRSLADFYCSIATAVGAPTDAFGKGGFEPVQGPLPELMA